MDLYGKKMEGGDSEAPQFMKVGKPQTLVVCTARFPMKEQVEEFCRKLRVGNWKDLASRDDLPKPLGISVLRYEILPYGDAGKGIELISFDLTKDGKVVPRLSEPLKTLLGEVMFDETSAEAMEPFLWKGLTTPMPMLAFGSYPKVVLDGGIDIDFAKKEDDEKDGPMGKKGPPMDMSPMKMKKKSGVALPGVFGKGTPGPMMMKSAPGVGQGQGNTTISDMRQVPIKRAELEKTDPDLAARLFDGKYDVFHAMGSSGNAPAAPAVPKMSPFGPMGMGGGMSSGPRFFSAWDVKTGDAMNPMGGPMGAPMMPPMMPPMTGPMGGPMGMMKDMRPQEWDRDAIVRFFDPDVVPGKTYRYSIQVRMKNPNYNKNSDVEYQQLATYEELLLDPLDSWVNTPTITIPNEYDLYAVDQHLLDDWAGEKKSHHGETKKDLATPKDHTTIQIHKWVGQKNSSNFRDTYVIGDWVIAERLQVRKGDLIGKDSVVQAPVWRPLKDTFEVPQGIEIKHRTQRGLVMTKQGIIIDMTPEWSDPAKRAIALPPMPPVLVDFFGGKRMSEDAAVDALVMSSDGKLTVLNSREQTDSANPGARERQERVKSARKRVEEVLEQGNEAGGPGGPMGVPGITGKKGGGA